MSSEKLGDFVNVISPGGENKYFEKLKTKLKN